VVQTFDVDDATDGAERQNSITILGDWGGAADAAGTAILIEGRILGQAVVISGNSDADTIELRHMVALEGHTQILGQGGEDRIILDRLPAVTTSHDRLGHLPAVGADRAVQDTIDLDGGAATDRYLINVTGGNAAEYIVNVHDTGAPADGADELTINGTLAPDVFLLREHFVAYLNKSGATSPARWTATAARSSRARSSASTTTARSTAACW
jgi:hypothetical protein